MKEWHITKLTTTERPRTTKHWLPHNRLSFHRPPMTDPPTAFPSINRPQTNRPLIYRLSKACITISLNWVWFLESNKLYNVIIKIIFSTKWKLISINWKTCTCANFLTTLRHEIFAASNFHSFALEIWNLWN